MEGEKRDSFVFYRSFYESTDDLDDKQFRELISLICERGLNRAPVASQDPTLNMMIMLIKPQLDANYRKAMAGKKGGRPRKKKPKPDEK